MNYVALRIGRLREEVAAETQSGREKKKYLVSREDFSSSQVWFCKRFILYTPILVRVCNMTTG